MPEDIEFTVTGIKEVIAKLDAAKRPQPIMKGMNNAAGNLVRWIRNNRLTGPRPFFLGVRSGALRASITFAPTIKSGDEYKTEIGTNIIYARIHEFGGIIKAKNAPYLVFQAGYGTKVFSKKGGLLKRPQEMTRWVRVKEVTMPSRPFMRPALQDEENRKMVLREIVFQIEKAVKEAK